MRLSDLATRVSRPAMRLSALARAHTRPIISHYPPTVEARERLFSALYHGRLEDIKRFFRMHARFDENLVSCRFFRTLVRSHPAGLYDMRPPHRYAGATALHVASWRGHAHVVRWLLEQGAAIDLEDAYGRTPSQVGVSQQVRELFPNDLPSSADEEYDEPPAHKGATWLELRNVQRLTITEDAVSADGHLHGLECAICMVAFADKLGKQASMLPCEHAFCEACVGRWLRTHNSCPMCRKRLAEFTLGVGISNQHVDVGR